MKSKKLRIGIIILSVVVGLVLLTGLQNYYKAWVFQAYKMPSGSMQPTLLVGDHFFADKSIKNLKEIQRGDVIIFAYPVDPRKDFVKRVIGMPGDTIEIKDKNLYINGELYPEEYVIHSDQSIFPAKRNPRDNFGPVAVPMNALFVLGDNRDESLDSRFFGFVEESKVKGRATTIYWSWDKNHHSARWDRIGKRIR